MTIKKAIDMRSYDHDRRTDDIYIAAADGEEIMPPPQDNLGRTRKLNLPHIA